MGQNVAGIANPSVVERRQKTSILVVDTETSSAIFLSFPKLGVNAPARYEVAVMTALEKYFLVPGIKGVREVDIEDVKKEKERLIAMSFEPADRPGDNVAGPVTPGDEVVVSLLEAVAVGQKHAVYNAPRPVPRLPEDLSAKNSPLRKLPADQALLSRRLVHRRVARGEHGGVGRECPGGLAVGVLKEDPLGGDPVDIGRSWRGIPIAAEPVRPESVERDQNHIRPGRCNSEEETPGDVSGRENKHPRGADR